jgi:hypothetical protein
LLAGRGLEQSGPCFCRVYRPAVTGRVEKCRPQEEAQRFRADPASPRLKWRQSYRRKKRAPDNGCGDRRQVPIGRTARSGHGKITAILCRSSITMSFGDKRRVVNFGCV